MNSYLWLVIATTLTLVFAKSTQALAYDVRTHGEITRRAYQTSQTVATYLGATGLRDTDRFDLQARIPTERLGLFENTGTVQDWMIEGSIREDEYVDSPVMRAIGCP